MADIASLQSIAGIRVNGHEATLPGFDEKKVILVGVDQYHILVEGRGVVVNLKRTVDHRHFIFKINQLIYKVDLIRKIDALVSDMGLGSKQRQRSESILSPMPGMVKTIEVTEGEEVLKGQNLLTLEAMKMENIIKSPQDGIIKSILVAPGDAVDKNQVLINF